MQSSQTPMDWEGETEERKENEEMERKREIEEEEGKHNLLDLFRR